MLRRCWRWLSPSRAAKVIPYLPVSIISAVNLAEAVTKAIDRDQPLAEARQSLTSLPIAIVPFDVEQAYLVSSLRTRPAPSGCR